MKKSLLPLAILAAMPLTALADNSVYGRAMVSVDYLDDGADYGEVNMASGSSRLGFKGSKDFDGITGFYQIEQEIDFTDSGMGWASRDTFVGIKGDFGSVRFGKFDTPFKNARGPANLFGDQMGDLRNLTRVGQARFDERTANTIHYQTKSFEGFQFNVAYSLHQGGSAQTDVKDQALSLSATYKQGALDLAAAYESFSENASNGKRDAFRLAGAYTMGDFTLVGLYQMADHDNDAHDSDVFGIGGTYKFTDKTRLNAHYFMRSADADDSDSNMLAVGVEHRIASQLRLFAIYAMVDNDDAVALTPWQQARTTSVGGAAGETATGLSFGLRLDF